MAANDPQVLLTTNLQLLHSVRRRPQARNFALRLPNEVQLLDAIALYLVNNIPGDVVAVGLDATPGGLQLVLARNDVTPTSEDMDTAREFFATVVSLQKPLDLLRFPLDHSLGFLKAKMRKVATIDMEIVDGFLDMYAFASFATEFRKILGLAEKLKRRWDLSDPHQLVRRTFIEMIAAAKDLSRTDAVIEHKTFVKFLIYPVFLSYCGFYSLRSCQSDRASRDMMEKYKRRIAKLERYHEGAYLIHEARLHHWPQDTDIPHVWISGPSVLDIDVGPSPLVAASNIFPTITEDKLVRANPAIIQHWKQTVRTFVHPELRLILHFDMQTPSSLRSRFLLDQAQMRCIGLSRQSCQCCAKWIDRWNDRRTTQWVTSGQNGLGFKTWKLTGYSELADHVVIGYVKRELTTDMGSAGGHWEPDGGPVSSLWAALSEVED